PRDARAPVRCRGDRLGDARRDGRRRRSRRPGDGTTVAARAGREQLARPHDGSGIVKTTVLDTDYGHISRLADQAADGAYLFAEHTVAAGRATPFRSHPRDHRSFVVIAGRVRLEGAIGSRTYGRLDGWHALPGCVHRIVGVGPEPAV